MRRPGHGGNLLPPLKKFWGGGGEGGCLKPNRCNRGQSPPSSSTVTTPPSLPGSTAEENILPATCWGLRGKLECTGLPSQVFLEMDGPSPGYLGGEVSEAGVGRCEKEEDTLVLLPTPEVDASNVIL